LNIARKKMNVPFVAAPDVMSFGALQMSVEYVGRLERGEGDPATRSRRDQFLYWSKLICLNCT